MRIFPVVALFLVAGQAAARIKASTGTGSDAFDSSSVGKSVAENEHVDFQELLNQDESDEEPEDLATHLASDNSEKELLDIAVGMAKQVFSWMEEHWLLVMTVFSFLIVVQTVFVAWVLGYLLKEEHYVIRAVRFNKSSPGKVFRILTDVEAYPLWRHDVKQVFLDKKKQDDLLGSKIRLGQVEYVITELKQDTSFQLSTHPSYSPESYAQPVLLRGAPVPQNINESHKKVHQEKVAKLKEEGIDATAHIPKFRPKNVHDLPAAPIFLPPGIPWRTQVWTLDLEATKDGKGSVVYLTYRGTVRSRLVRFWQALVGFDGPAERLLGDLGAFLGETQSPTVKPVLGKLPDLDP